MNTRESELIKLALDYKKQYRNCFWLNLKKRWELYRKWKETLAMIGQNIP